MYNYKTKKHCHIGPKSVMKIGKSTIWAGSYTEMRNDMDWDFRIRISDQEFMRRDTVVTSNYGAEKLLSKNVKSVTPPPTLDIEWEDFGTPDLDKAWWHGLAADIKRMPEGNIAVFCYGGHGRTGTVLSILAGVAKLTQGDPVTFIRKNYCDEAVESPVQIRYIELITGLKVKEQSRGGTLLSYGQQGFGTTQGAAYADSVDWISDRDNELVTEVEYVPEMQAIEDANYTEILDPKNYIPKLNAAGDIVGTTYVGPHRATIEPQTALSSAK